VTVDDLVVRLGLPLATFLYCVASGLVPILNAEIFLVGVAAISPDKSVAAVAILGALGQMIAKSGMYLGGRGMLKLPLGKRRADLDAVQARIERWRSKDLLVFVSASVGLPPFFAVSIFAGTLRFPFVRFMLAGFLGRLLRFGLVVAVPAIGRRFVGGG
jgi:membrane protein YqaA with SNARE-associated domain